jgi:glycerophosphoryl diester phosphodiesterase
MLVIAHRGASGYAPENTLAAFRIAAEMGAEYVETDLQLTRDGRLVAIHDETLERTTDGRGPVAGATLEELRKLDAGRWFRGSRDFAGERIPTIEEVLAFGRETDVGLYLEMKVAGGERALVDALRAANCVERAVVLSFDLGVLAEVRRSNSSIVSGYLYSDRRENTEGVALGAGARQILPRADRITCELVEKAHRSGLKVIAWTVNVPGQMKELMRIGIDGIISNYPDKLVALVRS